MEHIHKEYVGCFSGFNDQGLRKAVKLKLEEQNASPSDIITVQRVTKKDRNCENVYSHTYKKMIQKSRKTFTVDKTIYYRLKVTRYNAWRLSLPAIPVRIWDEYSDDWWIPQSAKEEGRKKGGKR